MGGRARRIRELYGRAASRCWPLVLPLSTWNYAGQAPSIRHVGPMAQDFYAAFGWGEDDRHISTVDADGVALAAIQDLYRLVQEQDAQITALEARVAALEQENSASSSSARPSSSGTATHCLLLEGLCLAGVVLGRIGSRTRTWQPLASSEGIALDPLD